MEEVKSIRVTAVEKFSRFSIKLAIGRAPVGAVHRFLEAVSIEALAAERSDRVGARPDSDPIRGYT
jgi:hypothetical protein